MKLKDVIDIDGKLYQIIHVSDDGSFEAEPIGEVVAKEFTRPQTLDRGEKLDKVRSFCNSVDGCRGCTLEPYKDCMWSEYTDEELDEACELIMKGDK